MAFTLQLILWGLVMNVSSCSWFCFVAGIASSVRPERGVVVFVFVSSDNGTQ